MRDDIIRYINNIEDVNYNKSKLVICPSMCYLPFFGGKEYLLGSQDISSFIDKTATGEVTGEQLKSLNVSYVLVGHSERRELSREINIDFINKISNATMNGLNVIYCIGETLSDRENGNTYIVLEKEISEVLNNVSVKNIMIAYEPRWAIGTGKIPKISEIRDTIEFIKDITNEKYDTNLDVLYGGSVTTDNLEDLLSIKEIDGFLVGGASLDTENVKKMLEIIEK